EELLCGLAPPRVRVVEVFHPLRAREPPDLGHAGRGPVGRHDTVDAAEVGRSFELGRFDLLAQVRRNQAVMLDDAAVHVADVERAIGTGREVYRTEALVRRG